MSYLGCPCARSKKAFSVPHALLKILAQYSHLLSLSGILSMFSLINPYQRMVVL